jgi:hypothetical protein
MSDKITRLSNEFPMILKIIEKYQSQVDPTLQIPLEEYQRRQKAVLQSPKANDLELGFVFSDEQYCGDVPYLGGNPNITIL